MDPASSSHRPSPFRSIGERSVLHPDSNESIPLHLEELVLVECTGAVGGDRNLRSLTVGDPDGAIQYDLSGAVRIADRMRRSYARLEEMTRGSEENLHQSTATEDIIALSTSFTTQPN